MYKMTSSVAVTEITEMPISVGDSRGHAMSRNLTQGHARSRRTLCSPSPVKVVTSRLFRSRSFSCGITSVFSTNQIWNKTKQHNVIKIQNAHCAIDLLYYMFGSTATKNKRFSFGKVHFALQEKCYLLELTMPTKRLNSVKIARPA